MRMVVVPASLAVGVKLIGVEPPLPKCADLVSALPLRSNAWIDSSAGYGEMAPLVIVMVTCFPATAVKVYSARWPSDAIAPFLATPEVSFPVASLA